MAEPTDREASAAAGRWWLTSFRNWLRAFRLGRSQPISGTDPDAFQAELHLIRRHLREWLNRGLQREHRTDDDRDDAGRIAIVVTTSVAGLVAVEQLLVEPALAPLRPRVVAVREPEYRLWCREHPDERHAFHINHWAWIKTRVPSARQAELAAFPLPPDAVYWIFRQGTAGPGSHHERSASLLGWNGRTLTMLSARLEERVTRLGGTGPAG